MAPPKAGWFRYLKEAFMFHWNLLLFGGATAAALIGPSPDMTLPLVAAGEVVYLAGLAGFPRFQAAIDARAAAERKPAEPVDTADKPQAPAQKLSDLLGSLDAPRRTRFAKLRARCVEMHRIANAVRGDTGDNSGRASELRTPQLDRLLWVFLRLLLSQQALERFTSTVDGAAMKKAVADLDARSKAAAAKGDDRIARAIKDNLATAQLRVDNFDKSSSNLEFVTVELDRIETKIQALTEMAISHSDPDALSAQVDAVAEGMSQTEQTIAELQNLTGLAADLDGAPQILSAAIDAPAVTR
jgi:hypothetical protein